MVPIPNTRAAADGARTLPRPPRALRSTDRREREPREKASCKPKARQKDLLDNRRNLQSGDLRVAFRNAWCRRAASTEVRR